MTHQHRKKPLKGSVCYLPLVLALFTATPVRAEGCIGIPCLLNGGPSELSTFTGFTMVFTTVGPFAWSSDVTQDGMSRHYAQGVRDDAAAYLATDGDLDGVMLDSAWREHLQREEEVQLTKGEFAHRILSSQG